MLVEHGYDFGNHIFIYSRPNPTLRGMELLESVSIMWRDVGVNAEVVVQDPATARDYRISGCGQIAGIEAQLYCATSSAPPPAEVSTHFYETTTSNVTLDLQRQLLLRASCHSINSRVCNLVPGIDGKTFQESLEAAIATPMGPERQQQMEQLAQTIHDEYWFLPLFVTSQMYGLAEDLEWEPRYDGRLRLNTLQPTY